MKVVVMTVRMVITLMNGQSEMPSDRDLFPLTFSCRFSPGLLLLGKTMVIPGWSRSIPRLKKHPSTISDSTGLGCVRIAPPPTAPAMGAVLRA